MKASKLVIPGVNLPEKIMKFFNLDMTQIKNKMIAEGKNQADADNAETEYKRFLIMMFLHPTENIVPNQIMDEMWHAHILDTRKYAADCQELFGAFVHHFPYFGLRGADDQKQLQDSFKRTCQLYEDEFGTSMTRNGDSSAMTCMSREDGGTQPDPKSTVAMTCMSREDGGTQPDN